MWIGFKWPRMGSKCEIFSIGAENLGSDTRKLLYTHV